MNVKPGHHSHSIADSDKFFLPISIGNFFYSQNRIHRIFDKFNLDQSNAVIVLCDTNRYLGYRGRGLTKYEALAKAKRESSEFATMVSREIGNSGRVISLKCMSDYFSNQRFIGLGRRLNILIRKERQLSMLFEDLANRYVIKFLGATDTLGKVWQAKYIFWETVLSLHVTEQEGYYVELYKDDKDMFISCLYDLTRSPIMSLVGKRGLSRQFVSLDGAV